MTEGRTRARGRRGGRARKPTEFGSRPGGMNRKAALAYLERHRVSGPEAKAA